MKKNIAFLGLFAFLFFVNSHAQTTITLQPSSSDGKDAVVWSGGSTINFGGHQSLTVYTWTNSGSVSNKRFFVEFDLSSLPASATILDAKLSLYYNPTDIPEGFDFHTGTNNLLIQRATTAWDENTINWSNQPGTDTTHQITLPPSLSPDQDYTDINVTDLVTDMHASSQGNFGFMARMLDEVNFYKALLFSSSDHPVDSLHPKLEITYTSEQTSIEAGDQMELKALIYPNPSQGSFSILLPEGPESEYEVEIYDILGKQVQHIDFLNQQITLDQKGIFFVKISDQKGKSTTQKVILQ